MQLSKSLLQTMGLALGLAMSAQNVSAKNILATSNECLGDSIVPQKAIPQQLEDKKMVSPQKMLQEAPLTSVIEEELGLVPAKTDTERKKPLKKDQPKPAETTNTDDFLWQNCGACCGRG